MKCGDEVNTRIDFEAPTVREPTSGVIDAAEGSAMQIIEDPRESDNAMLIKCF